MRRCRLGALFALLAACAGRDPAPVARDGSGEAMRLAADASHGAAANGEADLSASSEPAASGAIELALEAPSNVACTLPSASWTGDLQLRAGGPVFATVAETKSTVLVPRERAAAFVTVHAPIELHGMLTVPRLYLAKPTLLGGFIAPLADTPIPAPGPHAEGRLSVAFDIGELFSDPDTVVQELRCDAITTMPADYDVRKWLRVPAGEPPHIQIESGAGFRISPELSPVARVSFATKVWLAEGWGSGARRVVLEGNRYFAVGWVARDDVQPRTMFTGIGTLGRIGHGSSGSSRLPTCTRDLPVFVQIGGERARVGALRARQWFIRQAKPPKELARQLAAGDVAIAVPGSWLRLAPGAVMFAKADDIAHCNDP